LPSFVDILQVEAELFRVSDTERVPGKHFDPKAPFEGVLRALGAISFSRSKTVGVAFCLREDAGKRQKNSSLNILNFREKASLTGNAGCIPAPAGLRYCRKVQ